MSFMAVVPAAGKGQRFGGDKLVARCGDETVLDRTIGSLLEAGALSVVVVGARPGGLQGVERLGDSRVVVALNPQPDDGMFSSIQTGLAVLASPVQVLVLPGDMPFVSPTSIAAIARESQRAARVIVPMYDGRRGHPISIAGSLVGRLLKADRSSNLKLALHEIGAEYGYVFLSDPGILRDIDTQDDLVSS